MAWSADAVSLLQPDAGVVLGIDLKRILASPAASMLRSQMEESGLRMTAMKGMTDWDRLGIDIEQMLVSVSAREVARTGKLTPGTADSPPALVLLKGQFNRAAMLKQLRGQAVETIENIALYAPPPEMNDKQDQRIAFLDSRTILAGDAGEVRAAIERRTAAEPAAPRKTLLARSAQLAASNEVWMLIDLPPGALRNTSSDEMASKMLEDVRAVDLGLSLASGLNLNMNLRTRSETAAQEMTGALQAMLALGAMGQMEKPEVADMMRRVQISQDVSSVRLSFNVDQESLERGIRQMRAGFSEGTVASGGAAPAPAAPREPPTPKRERNTILIEGLENGPVEIPSSPRP
ncbi:MAG: hypothetical protein IPM24_24795 [Bryobacterales bacterium]|nr:hypothetical protein [Bryobacterales bacterium]